MQYMGQNVGSYCLYPSSSCQSPRPYSQALAATSIDGSGGTYCAPPALTTCRGLLDATAVQGSVGKRCEGDEDCGVPGVSDGNCNEARNCTYGCSKAGDCASPAMCLQNGDCG